MRQFGQRKKEIKEQRKEISNQAFEYLCYDVTKRVQENQE
jgi:hypothetical protein